MLPIELTEADVKAMAGLTAIFVGESRLMTLGRTPIIAPCISFPINNGEFTIPCSGDK